MKFKLQLIATVLCLFNVSRAQAQDSLLVDSNGDGAVSVLSFGDSITFGIGDGTPPGEFVEEPSVPDGRTGYPGRLETLTNLPVQNDGIPGEQLVNDGIDRVPGSFGSSSADVVVILEGSNDATHLTSDGDFQRGLQRIVNVARAYGKTIVLGTIPPACCNHSGRAPFFSAYNDSIREVGLHNNLRIMDVERAFNSTCVNRSECELLNLPEGLHPNSLGYDVIAQTALGTLSGIDIFSADGAANLEEAFGLPAGTIIVKPEIQEAVQ